MEWFNIYGLIIIVIMMIPNIVYSIKCKDAFTNYLVNKKVELFEQIGRYGSFILMIISIPYVSFGFINNTCFILYLIINAILLLMYCLIWIIYFRKNNLFRALSLSIIPSVIFIFSGIMSLNIPLIIFSIIFAICHITISYKNCVCKDK